MQISEKYLANSFAIKRIWRDLLWYIIEEEENKSNFKNGKKGKRKELAKFKLCVIPFYLS